MGKTSKVVVCGMKGVGKTAILEQAIYGNVTSKSELYPTIEDIYVANIESDKGAREKMRFYDTAGIESSQTSTAHGTTSQQLLRHYLVLADGYILVYDTDKLNSLDVLVSIKKDIDKNKDKKELPQNFAANFSYYQISERVVAFFCILYDKMVTIIVIGNRTKEPDDSSESPSVINRATDWCNREKIRHFTASSMQRTSLYEPFVYITSKLNPPPSKSTFTPLSMGRKVLKDNS